MPAHPVVSVQVDAAGVISNGLGVTLGVAGPDEEIPEAAVAEARRVAVDLDRPAIRAVLLTPERRIPLVVTGDGQVRRLDAVSEVGTTSLRRSRWLAAGSGVAAGVIAAAAVALVLGGPGPVAAQPGAMEPGEAPQTARPAPNPLAPNERAPNPLAQPELRPGTVLTPAPRHLSVTATSAAPHTVTVTIVGSHPGARVRLRLHHQGRVVATRWRRVDREAMVTVAGVPEGVLRWRVTAADLAEPVAGRVRVLPTPLPAPAAEPHRGTTNAGTLPTPALQKPAAPQPAAPTSPGSGPLPTRDPLGPGPQP